jgi:apolipoprotein D and lipocalin family protein
MKFLRSSAIVVLLALLNFGCANQPRSSSSTMKPKVSTPLRTVQRVDLPRFMGDWRVIANIPYFAEKGCVDSIETYALRPDGKIDNFFTYRKKSFDAPQKRIQALARVHDTRTNAEWRIRFFGLITVDYLILDVDPDYQWTVIGHPSRKYGWIMAREKTLPDAVYNGILERLAKQGYDPAKFKKVPQLPSQLAYLH